MKIFNINSLISGFRTKLFRLSRFILDKGHIFAAYIDAIRLYWAIQKTPPVMLDRICSTEIFSLVSHDRVSVFLLCMKSFSFYSRLRLPIVVFDDGTLTSKDVARLAKHLIGVRVVSKHSSDVVVEKLFRVYPWAMKQRTSLALLKKITDFYAYRINKKILMLDSDIIFYRKPQALVHWIQSADKVNFFMDDYKSFYLLSKDECLGRYGRVPIERLNSGLICIQPNALSQIFLSEFVKGVLQVCEDRIVDMFCLDQTYYALLFSKSNIRKNVSRLSSEYFLYAKYTIGNSPLPKNPICMHYTGLFMRSMYKDGLRLLEKENFFRAQ